MSLSSKEAAQSLAEAESAAKRSAQLYTYRKSSPHLIMWGIIWVIGYTSTALFGAYVFWGWIWGVLMLAGIAGGLLINRQTSRNTCGRGPYAWRMGAIMLIAVFFAVTTYAIMWPVGGRQFAAFPVLITGTVYMGVGLWAGLRYVLSGVAVVGLALFGFYYVENILYWMAFVGGGSMILAGIWFRTV